MSIHRTTGSVIFRQPVLYLRWTQARQLSTARGMSRSRQLALRSRAHAIQPIRANPFAFATVGGVLGAAIIAFSQTSGCESSSVVLNLFGGASGGAPSSPKGKDGKAGGDHHDPIEKLINQLTSNLGDISFGSAVGFCSGYAVKQIGKVAAVSIGILFIASQVASKHGYVDINWKKVEQDVVNYIDPNGDGRITKEDLHTWYKKFMAILKQNVPSSGGFACGFLVGLTCA